MVMKVLVNSLGVALATLGAFLVWYIITELNFSDKNAYLSGQGSLTRAYPVVTQFENV